MFAKVFEAAFEFSLTLWIYWNMLKIYVSYSTMICCLFLDV